MTGLVGSKQSVGMLAKLTRKPLVGVLVKLPWKPPAGTREEKPLPFAVSLQHPLLTANVMSAGKGEMFTGPAPKSQSR